ncbi:hypothetical protein C4D60_Mb10t12120 [Musa balbisiana]|uniref:Uncharacterized protein n=1 Tax=Musa balbisiana TaxID=52838 RepID=A0A4S8IXD1_MUSBA|nr:hypothetical protein C4D60_Mb10t12120 [Musa balbisiana]
MDYNKEGSEINRRSKEQLTELSIDNVVDHRTIPKVISRAQRKIDEAYLQMANKMVYGNRKLILMRSCVRVMLMRGRGHIFDKRPKMDIVLSEGGRKTGFLASNKEEYTEAILKNIPFSFVCLYNH